jgi:ABC-type transporter Mla MlaB component
VKQKNTGIFIRGGPYKTFKICSKPTFQEIALITKLDLMLLSHIDNDGIIPLIELMEVIKNQREMVIYLVEFN